MEIKEITYREMRELSYAGFSVFHDEALMPVYKIGVPVNIKIQIIHQPQVHVLYQAVLQQVVQLQVFRQTVAFQLYMSLNI